MKGKGLPFVTYFMKGNMATEHYVESLIIRQDNRPEVTTPMFVDDDCDKIYKFDGQIQLKQIVKSVQNRAHNRHDYVFVITNIQDLEEV